MEWLEGIDCRDKNDLTLPTVPTALFKPIPNLQLPVYIDIRPRLVETTVAEGSVKVVKKTRKKNYVSLRSPEQTYLWQRDKGETSSKEENRKINKAQYLHRHREIKKDEIENLTLKNSELKKEIEALKIYLMLRRKKQGFLRALLNKALVR